MAKKKHTVSNTRITTCHIVLPGDTNTLGTIFGGKVMQWIDIAATIAAVRHCRHSVVTASIDDLHFLNPILLGYHVYITAEVSYTGRTSMEIEVKVESENPITADRQTTSVAYLTFVALDSRNGKPAAIPPIVPETEEEMQRYAAAKKRKEERLKGLDELRKRVS
jgi:acyl-CoA hydrolase